MSTMFLDFDQLIAPGPAADELAAMRAAGVKPRTIHQLLLSRPDWTEHMNRFTNAVMRGPGALPVWQRELIAGLTSRGNHCNF